MRSSHELGEQNARPAVGGMVAVAIGGARLARQRARLSHESARLTIERAQEMRRQAREMRERCARSRWAKLRLAYPSR
jgi:hypothetical protein